MPSKTNHSNIFVAGGDLAPNAPSYVERPADDELLNLTKAGAFCYVLTTRQMGKSSLMKRTAGRLKEQGVRSAIINLAEFGSTVTPAQWYLGLLTRLEKYFNLSQDPIEWWQARDSLSDVQRFTDFLGEIVLKEVTGQIVIFIDEIDTTLKLTFTDDFFLAIRSMYNARANAAEFKRLSFVFLGVARPTDLIKDSLRTPFNVGLPIALSEFNRTDAEVLQKGLENIYPGQGAAIFDRIDYWTSGHPYLTQKLCLNVAITSKTHWDNPQLIDALVEQLFVLEAGRTDSNLQFVQAFILNSPNHRQLLKLYQRVYEGEDVHDNAQSSIHNQLKLSGVVKIENGLLTIRNRIYHRVFDLEWVKKKRKASYSDFFVADRPLTPDIPSYVKRPADDELLNMALAGTFCYLFAPHQMGKSSLIKQTVAEMEAQGVKTALIELTWFANLTVDQSYLRLLTQLKQNLGFATDPSAWWQRHTHLGYVQRFSEFLGEVVLKELTGKIVIFIDDIDSSLKLAFNDDFFAAIRAMYNARADEAEFNRLSFVLAGVALPSELIKDNVLTPFNIGLPIALSELSLSKASVLQEGLAAFYPTQAQAILHRIYHWTSGHPYLTQKLCLKIALSGQPSWNDEQIEQLVKELFLSDVAGKDRHIQAVQDFILNHPQRPQLLSLYKKICQGKHVTYDAQSIIQPQLKLSGLIKSEKGQLHHRNRIYQLVFSLAWVKENSQTPSKKKWALIPVTLALLIGLCYMGDSIENYLSQTPAPATGTEVIAVASVATNTPTNRPTNTPTTSPTNTPTTSPTNTPTTIPTHTTTTTPPNTPTTAPTSNTPTTMPSNTSTPIPPTTTFMPTPPSQIPTPTKQSTRTPSVTTTNNTVPTSPPTATPQPTFSATATEQPNIPATARAVPTLVPTQTVVPTLAPTQKAVPTLAPTQIALPTLAPTQTALPTLAPTQTALPTLPPTLTPIPTLPPTETPIPTLPPTLTPIPTLPPTETPIPTVPPTETPIPTLPPTETPVPTIPPTETPIPTMPPTAVPTPTVATRVAYQAPQLMSPENGRTIRRPILLEWSWNGTLQDDEQFDVRVWREGQAANGVTWTKDSSYLFDPQTRSGNYLWSVAVIRGRDGKWEADLSGPAEPRTLQIQGDSSSSGGGGSNEDDGSTNEPRPTNEPKPGPQPTNSP